MAENTKENLLKAPYVYYISNPKVPELYCLAVPMYVDLSENIKNYELPNWHTKAPSKDLVNPVWSLDVADWVEADENSQGAILAKQAKQISNLMSSSEKQVSELSSKIDSFTAQTTKTVTALQQSQVITVQQSTELSKSLEAFKGSQEATNKTLQQLTMMVSQLAKPANNETTDKN